MNAKALTLLLFALFLTTSVVETCEGQLFRRRAARSNYSGYGYGYSQNAYGYGYGYQYQRPSCTCPNSNNIVASKQNQPLIADKEQTEQQVRYAVFVDPRTNQRYLRPVVSVKPRQQSQVDLARPVATASSEKNTEFQPIVPATDVVKPATVIEPILAAPGSSNLVETVAPGNSGNSIPPTPVVSTPPQSIPAKDSTTAPKSDEPKKTYSVLERK